MKRLLLLALLLVSPIAWAAGVDINTADATALQTLPGIGESKAAAIIQYRTEHGPFKSVEELDNVSGIGESTMASIRDLVTVGGGTATAASAATTPTTTATTTSSPASTSAGCPVNINTADAAALDILPGIGESKAAAILQYRTDNGPFASCEGLDNVSGIGEATMATILPCCAVK